MATEFDKVTLNICYDLTANVCVVFLPSALYFAPLVGEINPSTYFSKTIGIYSHIHLLMKLHQHFKPAHTFTHTHTHTHTHTYTYTYTHTSAATPTNQNLNTHTFNERYDLELLKQCVFMHCCYRRIRTSPLQKIIKIF